MFYLVGDTHGKHDLGKVYHLLYNNILGEDDYIIILGDVALFWDDDWSDTVVQDFWKNVPCTVLWIDGNHENFDLIDKLPVTEWNGGRVQIIYDKIIHLMRGEVYTIEGKTFFVFGGGQSIDRAFRTEGHSWWPQEMPTKEEYDNGRKNLEKVNYKVDYVLTHTAPNFICQKLVNEMYPGEEELQDYFGEISYKLDFKKWFFGHWHKDRILENDTYYALYNDVHNIER